MNSRPANRLYRKCQAKHFHPKHVGEVGVYHPQTSNILDFIWEGTRTFLVEADPRSISKIHSFFGDQYPITLHEVAVFDQKGTIQMQQYDASTFVKSLDASPALVNDNYQVKDSDTFEVEAVQFHEIDPGDLDLLSIDIEGSEWFVLKYMKSRPQVLSIETHGKSYVNPYMSQIQQWVDQNGYQVWFKDKSDTVFVKNGLFVPTMMEQLSLSWMNSYIKWRRFKSKVKKMFK